MNDSLKKKLLSTAIPVGLALVIIAVMGIIMSRDTQKLLVRAADKPPVIEFTWSPAGAVSLLEMKAMLKITDDYGLDFTTYHMKLVELDRDIDLPIPGLIGKDYEQPISFSLIANDPKLIGLQKLTVITSISDDRGQKSELTRVIDLRQDVSINPK
jgi:hypothetical protein